MSPFAQGLVDQDLPPRIKKVIGHQHNRHRLEQLTTHVLPAQPLLQLAKRKYYFTVHRNDLSVNDGARWQRPKRLNQLRKAVRDLIHGPRVDSNSSRLDMCLRTNPIKLIFN